MYDAATEAAEGPLFMNLPAFALQPDGSEPDTAAAYDALVPLGPVPDRRYLARSMHYVNAAYRNHMGLPLVHQRAAVGVAPDFQSREFGSMIFLPRPLPGVPLAVVPLAAAGPAAAGAAPPAPAVPVVAESIAF
jgi:hypothetical protein